MRTPPHERMNLTKRLMAIRRRLGSLSVVFDGSGA